MYPNVLMQVNPPLTILTRLLWVNFPSHLCFLIAIELFSQGSVTEQGERRAVTMGELRSPTVPPPRHRAPPPTSHLSPAKESSKRAPRHFASLRVAGGIFPLHFMKSFFYAHPDSARRCLMTTQLGLSHALPLLPELNG